MSPFRPGRDAGSVSSHRDGVRRRRPSDDDGERGGQRINARKQVKKLRQERIDTAAWQ